MKNRKLSTLFNTTSGVLIVVSVVLLGADFLDMALLDEVLIPMFKLSGTVSRVIDAVLVTAVVAPMLYFALRKMQVSQDLLRKRESQLQTIIENLTEGLTVFGLEAQLLQADGTWTHREPGATGRLCPAYDCACGRRHNA